MLRATVFDAVVSLSEYELVSCATPKLRLSYDPRKLCQRLQRLLHIRNRTSRCSFNGQAKASW